MSKYYTALVSNEGLDAIRSDFKIMIKADSLTQARSGAAARIITVDRATDQEIFEAGVNGNVVLNLSDVAIDKDQHILPLPTPMHVAVDMTQPSAHDELEATPLSTGSRPAWLPGTSSNAPAVDTGD